MTLSESERLAHLNKKLEELKDELCEKEKVIAKMQILLPENLTSEIVKETEIKSLREQNKKLEEEASALRKEVIDLKGKDRENQIFKKNSEELREKEKLLSEKVDNLYKENKSLQDEDGKKKSLDVRNKELKEDIARVRRENIDLISERTKVEERARSEQQQLNYRCAELMKTIGYLECEVARLRPLEKVAGNPKLLGNQGEKQLQDRLLNLFGDLVRLENVTRPRGGCDFKITLEGEKWGLSRDAIIVVECKTSAKQKGLLPKPDLQKFYDDLCECKASCGLLYSTRRICSGQTLTVVKERRAVLLGSDQSDTGLIHAFIHCVLIAVGHVKGSRESKEIYHFLRNIMMGFCNHFTDSEDVFAEVLETFEKYVKKTSQSKEHIVNELRRASSLCGVDFAEIIKQLTQEIRPSKKSRKRRHNSEPNALLRNINRVKQNQRPKNRNSMTFLSNFTEEL